MHKIRRRDRHVIAAAISHVGRRRAVMVSVGVRVRMCVRRMHGVRVRWRVRVRLRVGVGVAMGVRVSVRVRMRQRRRVVHAAATASHHTTGHPVPEHVRGGWSLRSMECGMSQVSH